MSTLKPYSVEISIVTVVMATDSTHAMQVAEETARESLGDVSHTDYDYGFGREIKSESQLSSIGWDGDCLPYGGDGRTRLSMILGNLQADAEAERDTKTIDMFEEKKA
ncbi:MULTISPECIES: hypothetical protein [unclassified Caballeronia]|uniref:hypothetical protein n=1 Tax=unclassified Caballeronia TaxID=2646786 RepID=UPI00285FD51B|nr:MULTISPECIES: hypothetical protein [unclassified Caballeronia]MDR5776244.1 hypothetical protein [Caballeronia sp. LZ002]MDR5801163.1 hypothetical protein [Caballeronia sp. LZ001]MDR5851684.1 hypothetical protein [Caballeronia sp. LZ003]